MNEQLDQDVVRRIARLEKSTDFLRTFDHSPFRGGQFSNPTNGNYQGRLWFREDLGKLFRWDTSVDYNGAWVSVQEHRIPKPYDTAYGGQPKTTASSGVVAMAYGTPPSNKLDMVYDRVVDRLFQNSGTLNGSNYWELHHYIANQYNQGFLIAFTNNASGTVNLWCTPDTPINLIVPANQFAETYATLVAFGSPGNIFIANSMQHFRELAPLVPQDIGGIQAWWRSDVPCIPYTNGGSMSYWGDGGIAPQTSQNGGLTNAQQGTGTNQPTWNTAVQNGMPAVRFDGTNDFMTVDNPGINPFNLSSFSIFAVAKSLGNGVSGTTQTIFGKGDAAQAVGSASRRKLQIGRSGSNFRVMSGSDSQFIDTPCDFTTGFHAVGWVANSASSHTIYVDSNAGVASSTTLDLTTFNTVAATLGQSFSTGLTENWNGYILEILLFNSALSDANALKVMAYLKNKLATP